MATTFPSMVEWMEQIGWDQLHMAHRDDNAASGWNKRSFDCFVQDLYSAARQDWNEDMCLESAKRVLAKIINNAICMRRMLMAPRFNEELGPDHVTSLNIVNDFMHQLIPAVDRMLKGFK